MERLPQYIVHLGRLRNDRAFRQIKSKLNVDKDGRGKVYPILAFRFWGHAHLYTPVFSLIFYYLIGNHQTDLNNVTLSLLMLSIGSLSFAICDSYGGAYADKHGFTSAIRLGIKWMIALMFFFGGITLINDKLGSTFFVSLWLLGQVLIGVPLALIDSADTELTKATARTLGAQGILEDKDGDRLEGICTKLKYSGIALTSFVGCFLFVVASVWLGISNSMVGALLFLLTALSQLIALWQLRQVQEPDKSNQASDAETSSTAKRQTEFGMLRIALKEIYADKVLLTWVLIIAVTDGWLLFATYYFQLNALKDLIKHSGDRLSLLLTIPILYGVVSQIASFGGSYFNTWQDKRAAVKRSGAGHGEVIRLRRGSILDIPYDRLLAAGEILGIMVGVFVLYFVVATFFPVDKKSIGLLGYFLSVIPLLFFASYQLLRGFAQPLLKTTLSNIAENKSLQNRTTTLSIASGLGRAFHMVCATLFTVCLILIGKGKAEFEIPTSTGALTATIVIVILTIIVLNVLCTIALDRKDKIGNKPVATRPLLNEIAIILNKRSFRATMVRGSFFVCLVLSNLLAPMHSGMGFLRFNAGAIPYALSFMFVETVAETGGKASSRRLWLAGICSYFVVGFMVLVALLLPGEQNPGVQNVFRMSLVYIFASLCSFSVAQYLDIWFFLLLKRVTRDKALWLRSNLSTFISQTVDTIIFITIALVLISWFFAEKPLTFLELGVSVIGQLGIKWMFSLVYTPLLYLIVSWVENGEPSDSKLRSSRHARAA
jgi:uncharacterized integral membrane protein (TIGR00697 family)